MQDTAVSGVDSTTYTLEGLTGNLVDFPGLVPLRIVTEVCCCTGVQHELGRRQSDSSTVGHQNTVTLEESVGLAVGHHDTGEELPASGELPYDVQSCLQFSHAWHEAKHL